jgi:hypothetical protein
MKTPRLGPPFGEAMLTAGGGPAREDFGGPLHPYEMFLAPKEVRAPETVALPFLSKPRDGGLR